MTTSDSAVSCRFFSLISHAQQCVEPQWPGTDSTHLRCSEPSAAKQSKASTNRVHHASASTTAIGHSTPKQAGKKTASSVCGGTAIPSLCGRSTTSHQEGRGRVPLLGVRFNPHLNGNGASRLSTISEGILPPRPFMRRQLSEASNEWLPNSSATACSELTGERQFALFPDDQDLALVAG
jgi:hypothetical protein